MGQDNKILTVEEASAYLRMHPATLRRKAKTGEIPGVKVAQRWLFKRADLDKLLGKGRVDDNEP